MTPRLAYAALFGALIGFAAFKLGAASSGIQSFLAGLLSAMGFLTASVMARGRLRAKQMNAPALLPGEEARLYGPGELSDQGGSSKAWIYATNRRLMLRDGEGTGLDLEFSEIEELRPPKEGLMSGEVALVARGRGLLTLRVPDAKRWHEAIQRGIRGLP